MATRAMYLTVKMDADTMYYSLVQAVFDYLATNGGYGTIMASTTGMPYTSFAAAIKTAIDSFFSNKKGAAITTTGTVLSSQIQSVSTNEYINGGTTASTPAPQLYFSPSSTYATGVNAYIAPYVRFKIASMTDDDYTAFVEQFRTLIKAAYPADRAWVETNSPTA
jgi:hypothetical protein